MVTSPRTRFVLAYHLLRKQLNATEMADTMTALRLPERVAHFISRLPATAMDEFKCFTVCPSAWQGL